jgi:hypothetical protein
LANQFIDGGDLYRTNYRAGCYGSVFDQESLVQAEKGRDLCLIKVKSVIDCAPGWSRQAVEDAICSWFTLCKSDFENETQRWTRFGAINVTEPGQAQTFQIPAEWNDLDDLADYWNSVDLDDLVTALLTIPPLWATVNAALLGAAAPGWLMIGIGIVASLLLGRREAAGGAPLPGRFQAASSATLLDSAPYE